jgi:hypothetical protein
MDKRLWDKRRGDRRRSWGNPGEATSSEAGVAQEACTRKPSRAHRPGDLSGQRSEM